MATRDPKTGRFVKTTESPKTRPESEDFFDEVPSIEEGERDIMLGCVYAIGIIAVCIIIAVALHFCS